MPSTRMSHLLLTGAVGLTGIGIGAALAPVAAGAAVTTTHAVHDRAGAIKDALSGLVKDGTLTQKQADKVAETLADKAPRRGFGTGGQGFGPGGQGFGPGAHRGPGLPGLLGLHAAADILGMSDDDLRAALQSGKTPAQIAESKGITQAELVDKLVAATKTELDAAVTAGRLTRAQADEIAKNLKERITARVTQTRPDGAHRGHGGPWQH